MKAMLTRLDERKAVELQFDPCEEIGPPFIFRCLGSRMPVLLNLDHRTKTWLTIDQMRLLMERKRIPKKTYEWAVTVAVEEML